MEKNLHSQTDIDQVLSEFESWLELNGYHNKSYFYLVKKFIKHTHISNTISITRNNIYNFLKEVKDKYSTEYFNLYIKSIKLFLKYLDISIDLPKLSKTVTKVPEGITEEFFEQELLPGIDLLELHNPLRAKAVLSLMFYTGIRKSEVYSLKRENFELDKGQVKIFEKKTNRERIVFYPKKVRDRVKVYFATEVGEKNAFNLGVGSIEHIFNRLEEAFPGRNLHPHLFRHSFAINWLEKGGDLASLQSLLGHQNIASTMIYAQRDQKRLKNMYDQIMK